MMVKPVVKCPIHPGGTSSLWQLNLRTDPWRYAMMTRQDLHDAIDALLDIWGAQYPEFTDQVVAQEAAAVVEMYCFDHGDEVKSLRARVAQSLRDQFRPTDRV